MKNVLLTVLLVFGFGIVLFLEGAPQGGEFVAEINSTLSQLSRDLPSVAKSASTTRVRRSDQATEVDTLITNAVAQSILASNDQTMARISAAEPDCGGWND